MKWIAGICQEITSC